MEEVCNRTTQSRLTTLYPPPLIHRRDWGGEAYAFRLRPATVKIWGRNPYPHGSCSTPTGYGVLGEASATLGPTYEWQFVTARAGITVQVTPTSGPGARPQVGLRQWDRVFGPHALAAEQAAESFVLGDSFAGLRRRRLWPRSRRASRLSISATSSGARPGLRSSMLWTAIHGSGCRCA